ncbi:MAG TPA: hypothetical protein VIT41_15030 [Microlunatus sp.]
MRCHEPEVEVGIQLPLGALIDPDDPTPAEIPGWGPISAGLARQLLGNGWLAELIRWHDWTCRDPHCDAPIRHLDRPPPPPDTAYLSRPPEPP